MLLSKPVHAFSAKIIIWTLALTGFIYTFGLKRHKHYPKWQTTTPMRTRIHFLNIFFTGKHFYLLCSQKKARMFSNLLSCAYARSVLSKIQVSNVFCSICWEFNCFNWQGFFILFMYLHQELGRFIFQRVGKGLFGVVLDFAFLFGCLVFWVFFFFETVLWHNYTIWESHVLKERRKQS